MKKTAKTQGERRAETQAAVLQSACKLFGMHGYNNTSLEDIAADCSTTIRPIYHYFKNKKNLFQVVTETYENQLVEALSAVEDSAGENNAAGDTVDPLHYWHTFSEMASNAAFRQVVLIDSPHILGRERWTNTAVVVKATEIIQKQYPSLQALNQTLITRMLIGALSEAAMVFAEADEAEGNALLNQISSLVSVFIK